MTEAAKTPTAMKRQFRTAKTGARVKARVYVEPSTHKGCDWQITCLHPYRQDSGRIYGADFATMQHALKDMLEGIAEAWWNTASSQSFRNEMAFHCAHVGLPATMRHAGFRERPPEYWARQYANKIANAMRAISIEDQVTVLRLREADWPVDELTLSYPWDTWDLLDACKALAPSYFKEEVADNNKFAMRLKMAKSNNSTSKSSKKKSKKKKGR